jgi:hypothetical protein
MEPVHLIEASDQPEFLVACTQQWSRVYTFEEQPSIHRVNGWGGNEPGVLVTWAEDLVTCPECSRLVGRA